MSMYIICTQCELGKAKRSSGTAEEDSSMASSSSDVKGRSVCVYVCIFGLLGWVCVWGGWGESPVSAAPCNCLAVVVHACVCMRVYAWMQGRGRLRDVT